VKSTGLGRGLSALLSDAETKESQGRLLNVPIKDIDPNPHQPRRDFKPEDLAELAASIREKGVIQPLVVRKSSSKSGRYQLIAGERRLRAASLAGCSDVPVRVLDVPQDHDMLELALIENLQREDLNPVDLALGYLHLIETYSFTQEQVSERLGKNRATVANTLRVLELPENVLNALRSGEISLGHAKAILMLQGAARQSALYKKIVAAGLSVRASEEAAKAMLPDQRESIEKEPPKQKISPIYEEFAGRLRGRLGTQVKIVTRGKKGSIRIEFYSEEDLERLMEMLGK
jgi:ParB family chromosome partitioning protein